MRTVLLTLSALLLGAMDADAQDAIDSTLTPDVAPAPAGSAPIPTTEVTPAPAVDRTLPAASEAKPEVAELTDAELQQLGFDIESPSVDYAVRLSGFADFSYVVPFGKTQILNPKPSFAIGNLNVYLTKNLTESIRTMAEVRILYLPNGVSTSLMDSTLVSTAVADYNDFGRPLRWGGVEIERVYVEWAAHQLLTIRVGQFLTPYGVWNVDHGSPTIITTGRPYVIGYNFFPERQTGFEVYGRWEATSNGSFGYHLTLSNGTGPASEYLDLDYNKAVGGRIFWEYRKWGELKIGGSAYYGRNTNSVNQLGIVDGNLNKTEQIKTQFDSLALAADATFKYRGIHVQAEFATQELKFTPSGRTASLSLTTFQNAYPSDGFRYGGYLLLGYRFDWFGIMPFALLQKVGGVDSILQSQDRSTTAGGGLNIRPIDSLVLKLEYAQVFFTKAQTIPGFDFKVFSAQLAWAF
jgi:hypothetical protein